MVVRSARARVRVGVQEHGDGVTPELRALLSDQGSTYKPGLKLSSSC